QRDGVDSVAERLDVERLLEGDVAVPFPGVAARIEQVGPQATGVHERDDRSAELGILLQRPELRIRHQVAEAGLLLAVLLTVGVRPGDVRGDRADDLVTGYRRTLGPEVDDALDLPVRVL